MDRMTISRCSFASGIFCFLQFISIAAFSAVQSAQKAPLPAPKSPFKNLLVKKGSLFGGDAGKEFSLVSVSQLTGIKFKGERWVIDIGDEVGQPRKGLPGFFHIELKEQPNLLSFDFSQMTNSMIDQEKLTSILSHSKYVKSTRLTADPIDQSTNMIWNLNKGIKAKIYQVVGNKNTSKIVVDLIE